VSSSPADEQGEGEEPGNRTRGIVPSCARGLYMYACVGIGLLGSVPGGGFRVLVSMLMLVFMLSLMLMLVLTLMLC
jgi:hypothetical protein